MKFKFVEDITDNVILIDVEKFLIKYSHKTAKEMIAIVNFAIDNTYSSLKYDDLADNIRIVKEKQLYRFCYLKDELNGYFAEINYGKVLKLVREKKENGNRNSKEE